MRAGLGLTPQMDVGPCACVCLCGCAHVCACVCVCACACGSNMPCANMCYYHTHHTTKLVLQPNHSYNQPIHTTNPFIQPNLSYSQTCPTTKHNLTTKHFIQYAYYIACVVVHGDSEERCVVKRICISIRPSKLFMWKHSKNRVYTAWQMYLTNPRYRLLN